MSIPFFRFTILAIGTGQVLSKGKVRHCQTSFPARSRSFEWTGIRGRSAPMGLLASTAVLALVCMLVQVGHWCRLGEGRKLDMP